MGQFYAFVIGMLAQFRGQEIAKALGVRLMAGATIAGLALLVFRLN